MFDSTGTRFDFSVCADIRDAAVLRFSQHTGDAIDINGMTFSFLATPKNGVSSQSLPLEYGVSPGELLLTIPALTAGEYSYELFTTSDTGDTQRIIYGVLTAISSEHAASLTTAASDASLRTLVITVPNIQQSAFSLRWLASSVAQNAAAEAQQSAQHAEQILSSVSEISDKAQAASEAALAALDKLNALDARIAELDGHILSAIVPNPATNTWFICGKNTGYQVSGSPGQSPKLSSSGTWMLYNIETQQWDDTGVSATGEDGHSPYINAAGNWCTWNVLSGQFEDTGLPAAGKNGVNGSSVRRILGHLPLPISGDNCNGGVYYYVRSDAMPAVAATGWISVEFAPAVMDLVINGVSIPNPESLDNLVDYWINAVSSANCGVSMTWNNNSQQFIITALQPGSNGNSITISTSSDYPNSGSLSGGADASPEHYDVYAWLEQGNGGSWVCVGLADDLATAEIYGLVKLGTDTPIPTGTPVGSNADGQMVIPYADYTMPGTMSPSTSDVLSSGGALGLDENKRLLSQPASYGSYGSVKPSTNSIPNTRCIGINDDGSIGVNWASLTSAGVVRLGSQYKQSNPRPYQLGVGATTNHELANNLVYGGALQHITPTGWADKNMPWLSAQMSATPEWFNDQFYLGLVTSPQFGQSQSSGLCLLPATSDRLAGVYLASSLSDTRNNAVPEASTVLNYLETHYYTSKELYSKKEIDETLKQYATVTALTSDYATKKMLQSLSGQVIHHTPSWHGDVILSEEDYEALETIDPLTKYYII